MAVAHRIYAKALFEAAKEARRLAPVREELSDFVAAVQQVPELRELLRNPQLDPRAKGDALAPVVDQLLDGAEGVALEDEERDQEADDRPDHQSRRDRDERVGGERHRQALDEDVGQDRAEQAVEDDGLGQREAEPLNALQLAA